MAEERSGKRRRRKKRRSRILPLTFRRGAGPATLPSSLPPGVGRVIGLLVLTVLLFPAVHFVLADVLLDVGHHDGPRLLVGVLSLPIAFGLALGPWLVIERFIRARRRVLYDRGRERASERVTSCLRWGSSDTRRRPRDAR